LRCGAAAFESAQAAGQACRRMAEAAGRGSGSGGGGCGATARRVRGQGRNPGGPVRARSTKRSSGRLLHGGGGGWRGGGARGGAACTGLGGRGGVVGGGVGGCGGVRVGGVGCGWRGGGVWRGRFLATGGGCVVRWCPVSVVVLGLRGVAGPGSLGRGLVGAINVLASAPGVVWCRLAVCRHGGLGPVCGGGSTRNGRLRVGGERVRAWGERCARRACRAAGLEVGGCAWGHGSSVG